MTYSHILMVKLGKEAGGTTGFGDTKSIIFFSSSLSKFSGGLEGRWH